MHVTNSTLANHIYRNTAYQEALYCHVMYPPLRCHPTIPKTCRIEYLIFPLSMVYPPDRNIIPYHRTESYIYTVWHRTQCHTVPYTVSYHTLCKHHSTLYRTTHPTTPTHTLSTPPEGLNHTKTQEEHAPSREQSTTNEYEWHTTLPTAQQGCTKQARGVEDHYEQGKLCWRGVLR